MYVDDMVAVYTKWLELMVDDQRPDGAVTDIVPAHGWWLRDGAPSYQSAYPTIAWALMHYSGDRWVAYRHHDSLVRYYRYGLQPTRPQTKMEKFLKWQGFAIIVRINSDLCCNLLVVLVISLGF